MITTSPGAPGGSLIYALTIRATSKGNEAVRTTMVSDIVAGSTTVSTAIRVLRR